MASTEPSEATKPAKKDGKSTVSQMMSPIDAFKILIVAHCQAALFSPIQDCDEVFNFWEPTHYLTHGFGLQTWEYSPLFAIRSWLYSALHALPIYVFSFSQIPRYFSKTALFYILRLALAVVCALCETRLFSALSQNVSPKVGHLFTMMSAFSAGMFHASVSYLPSSFAMCTFMLAASEFLQWRRSPRTAYGLLWLGLGTIVGWPFVAVLAAPFVLEDLALSYTAGRVKAVALRLYRGLVKCFGILALEIAFDTLFYQRVTCVPFNIVKYNVFSSKGPELYGTEPWDYYFRNLFINFNIWFLLALVSAPLMLLHQVTLGHVATRQPWYHNAVLTSPFYLWLAIFTLQPHKEERFMYPIYPSLLINAALSIHIMTFNVLDSPPMPALRLPSAFKRLLRYSFGIFLALGSPLNALRSLGLATAYNAPLKVYSALQDATSTDITSSIRRTTVCVGKEWYRFPSSYFLPENSRLAFVKSDFSGLLPGHFREFPAGSGVGLFPGTHMIPDGMNDENREDMGKYTHISQCDYMVDSLGSEHENEPVSPLEPRYAMDDGHWERVLCVPFLDTKSTGVVGRLIWTPQSDWMPEIAKRRWGEYCLLRNKHKETHG